MLERLSSILTDQNNFDRNNVKTDNVTEDALLLSSVVSSVS